MKIIDINGSEREVKKAFLDPEFSGYVRVEFKRHHEWYSIKEFLQFNPKLKHIVKGAPDLPEDISGVISSADKNIFVDKEAKWKPNSYMDFMVWISRGKGEGQKRHIIKNTENIMTLNKSWDVIPDSSSQYVVAEHITDVPAMGNTLASQDMEELEEKAIQMDIARGIQPHERQYTQDPEDEKN